jgi:hypothetical protein
MINDNKNYENEISKDEYIELVEKQRKLISALEKEIKRLVKLELQLEALESAGVDNWEGYPYAMDILEELEKG